MVRIEVFENKIVEFSGFFNFQFGNMVEILCEIEEYECQFCCIKDVKFFYYSYQGFFVYIGSEKVVVDVIWFNGNVVVVGGLIYFFWRSVYISMCFSIRNCLLVINDWFKFKFFGCDFFCEQIGF